MTKLPLKRHMNKTTDSEKDNRYDLILEQKELSRWKYVKETNDMKGLWNAINIKGEFKQSNENQLDVNELASLCNKKSKIDLSQTVYKDLQTNIRNEELDKRIDEKEIEEAAEKLNDSKSSDGIASSTVKHLIPTLMTTLVILYNLVFFGGTEAYPTDWITFVNGIPKKGILEPPKYIRFISIMGIFEKIYQIILSTRLCSFLKIPSQQTAFQ